MTGMRYGRQAGAREGGTEKEGLGWRSIAISRRVVVRWDWQWCADLHSVVVVVLTTVSAVERREEDEGTGHNQLVLVIWVRLS